jgi:hypothetical protein
MHNAAGGSPRLESEFIRKQYDHEVDRQDRIVASLSLPVGVLTVLGSIMGIVVRGYSNEFLLLNWVFYPLVTSTAISFAVGMYFLIRAYFGQTYQYLPRLSELAEYEKGLVAYYQETGEDQSTAEESARRDFAGYLAGKVVQAASQNAFNNDEKSAFRYRANWAVVAVLLLMIMSGVPYVIDQSISTEKVPTVHVDNLDATLKEILDAASTRQTGPAATAATGTGEQNDQRGSAANSLAPTPGANMAEAPQTPSPQPAPSTPQRPVAPDNRPVRSPDPSSIQNR